MDQQVDEERPSVDGSYSHDACPESSTSPLFVVSQQNEDSCPCHPTEKSSRMREDAAGPVAAEGVAAPQSGSTLDVPYSRGEETDAQEDEGNDALLDDDKLLTSEIYHEVFGLDDKGVVESLHRSRLEQRICQTEHTLYISCFALFGTVLRIYMARFFGLDCEYKNTSSATVDFLSPLADRICVTASGKTAATGGALFIDLPANMLGSFFMGLLTPSVLGHNIAWFRQDHPLQDNQAFYAALRIGFCGSLTTFSSWNTQMVVMMDGTATVLGPQVMAALFGYAIGIMCSIASFIFGTHIYRWWITIHPESNDMQSISGRGALLSELDIANGAPETSTESSRRQHPTSCNSRCCSCWEKFLSLVTLRVVPFLIAAAIVGVSLYVGEVENMAFYQKLWLSAIMAPLGAILRWKLSRYNTAKGYWKRLEFIPWGTLAANLLACLCSLLGEVFNKIFTNPASPWLPMVLLAIQAGFAGSLSTVSTFVAELVLMKTLAWSYVYGIVTIGAALLLGLVVYCPLIRI